MSLKRKEDIVLRWDADDANATFRLELYQGAYIALKDWTSSRSFGNFWHLYWNSRAGASVFFAGKEYPFKSANVYLIPAHTLFSTRLRRPVDHFYVDFSINGHFKHLKYGVYSMDAGYLKSRLPAFIQTKDFHLRKNIIYSMLWHYLSEIPGDFYLQTEQEILDRRIAQAIAIMEQSVQDPPNVQKLSKRVGMSATNFYLLFRKETNKTPMEFMMQLRMNRANSLLCHTDESIDEIAAQCGFADRYHFSKYFKKKAGMAPVEYRRNSPYAKQSDKERSQT
jgi:AraC-like DNA-binding protein